MTGTLHCRLYADAESWLADCFEDCPEALTIDEIRRAIDRHYDGGFNQFCRDNQGV